MAYSSADGRALCQPIQDQVSGGEHYDSYQGEDDEERIDGSSPLSLKDPRIFEPMTQAADSLTQHDGIAIYATDGAYSTVATLRFC